MIKLLITILVFVFEVNGQLIPQGCLEAFRNAALQLHNDLRLKHSVQQLIRDSNVDLLAQNSAQNMARTTILTPTRNLIDTGENIFGFYSSRAVTLTQCSQVGQLCVQKWYDQVSQYDFSNPRLSSATAQFTQVVWRNSKNLGLGLGIGKYMGYNAYYCVGQYQPAGNTGSFQDNVFPASVNPPFISTSTNFPTTTRTTTRSITTITTITTTSATITTSTPSSSSNLPPGCLEAFRGASLNAHNLYRSKHSAPPLAKDSELDNSAQSYATQMGITNVFAHSNRANTGENLYAAYNSKSLTLAYCEQLGNDCVKSWYDEISTYDYTSPGFSSGTGHFTQVVWVSSNKLGMGLGFGKKSSWNAYYCVAQYSPPGNYAGQYKINVLPLNQK